MPRGHRLGDCLSEDEQNDGDDGSGHGDSQVLVVGAEDDERDARGDGRRAGVHEVVAKQYGGQQALRVLDHVLDTGRPCGLRVHQVPQPQPLNGEQRGLRT